ncbi:MAG: hypothetical protein Q9201_003160 [Fulgogasparrea decipioides]
MPKSCNLSDEIEFGMLGAFSSVRLCTRGSLSMDKDLGTGGTDGTVAAGQILSTIVLSGRLRFMGPFELTSVSNVEFGRDLEVCKIVLPEMASCGLSSRFDADEEGEEDLGLGIHDLLASLERDRDMNILLPLVLASCSSNSPSTVSTGGSRVHGDTATLCCGIG